MAVLLSFRKIYQLAMV